jgi:hypothetical protein
LPTPNIDIVDSGELDQLLRSQQQYSHLPVESGGRSAAGTASKISSQVAPTQHPPPPTTTTTAAAAVAPRKKTALEKKFDSSSDEDDDLNSYL